MPAAQLELPISLDEVTGVRAIPGDRLGALVELVLRDRTVIVASLITTAQAQRISALLIESWQKLMAEIEHHGRMPLAEHYDRLRPDGSGVTKEERRRLNLGSV